MASIPYRLENVVPWGRNFDEYVRMFDLDASDLAGSILGCGDGPASFNAESAEQGGRVVSADPLYQFSAHAIHQRIDETRSLIIKATREHLDDFNWDYFADLDALVEARMAAMARFLEDFDDGKRKGRYIPASVVDLPFQDHTFDMALSSHFLLLYSDQLDYDFHLDAFMEMKRVARHVRVYPTLNLDTEPSPHLSPLMDALRDNGHSPELRTVPYEFQKGGNQMLVF
jgi:hypothetical protein